MRQWDCELRLIQAHENNKRHGAIFTLHFEISRFGVGRVLQCVNYISASEVYISRDRYIHRVRGFVEGEVLTNEFEMVENVFRAMFARAHRTRWTSRVSEIFSRSIQDTYLYRYERVSRWNRIFHSRFAVQTAAYKNDWNKRKENGSVTAHINITLQNKYSSCL